MAQLASGQAPEDTGAPPATTHARFTIQTWLLQDTDWSILIAVGLCYCKLGYYGVAQVLEKARKCGIPAASFPPAPVGHSSDRLLRQGDWPT
eukprot:821619-Pleurochrysis_carterae.AAC.1